MSTEHPATPAPIALQPSEGEALWFMGFLATIKASAEGTAGRVAVIHHLGPQDAGSPLHVHHREDEWFYVLDGELTVWVGGQVIRAPAGSFVFGPQGTPHTFTVSSPGGASFLLVTEPGGFEAFMRTVAEPARSLTLPPPPDSPPTPHSSPPSPPNTASKSSARPASPHKPNAPARGAGRRPARMHDQLRGRRAAPGTRAGTRPGRPPSVRCAIAASEWSVQSPPYEKSHQVTVAARCRVCAGQPAF